jgi:hypothetical protein
VVGAIGLIKDFCICLDGDFILSGNGVVGVDADIGEELIELRRIDLDRREVSAEVLEEVDILTDKPAQHIQHPFHSLIRNPYVEVHNFLLAAMLQKEGRFDDAFIKKIMAWRKTSSITLS